MKDFLQINIRSLLNHHLPYFTINREEHNLSAIFYHVLLINNNLEKFLSKINTDFPIIPEKTEIYFEYAYLRDIWYSIGKSDNEKKRYLILKLLKPDNIHLLQTISIQEFNQFFGAVSMIGSPERIRSPRNWSINRFKENISNNNEFLKVCKFKWCFNVKPDIVIHTSDHHAICIEGKCESGEVFYPSIQPVKNEFFMRGLSPVGQTEIQMMLMELLGFESKYILLTKNPTKSETHETWLWRDAFRGLDFSGCPYFITEWIKRL